MKTITLTVEQVELLQGMIESHFELLRQSGGVTADEAARLRNLRNQLEFKKTEVKA